MSFINFSNIKAYIESKINVINTLTTIEASQVAVNAFQLARIGYAPSNLSALETYLSNKEAAVSATDELKYITQLLGSSTPTKSVVWRMREFLTDGTFTVPNNLAGDCVYITGSGGGGSGGAGVFLASTTLSLGGANSGCYIKKQPYASAPSSTVSVTVGAGGAPVSATSSGPTTITNGQPGGDSIFGGLILKGGQGGRRSNTAPPIGGWKGGREVSGAVFPPESSIMYSGGNVGIFLNATAYGSAAGGFGSGADGKGSQDVNDNGFAAANNSGAGGGSVCTQIASASSVTATSGAGGSGRFIVEWQEFL